MLLILMASLGTVKVIEVIDRKCRIYKFRKLVEQRQQNEKSMKK
jgi:hypothetical protein